MVAGSPCAGRMLWPTLTSGVLSGVDQSSSSSGSRVSSPFSESLRPEKGKEGEDEDWKKWRKF